jgi:glycosyltransferase involved in cell wall biosynthesis
MIYVCTRTHNSARTAGLVLWKLRKVFEEFPREYHVLVLDDASTDDTRETLEAYQGALPMNVTTRDRIGGYAAGLEGLLRDAADRTDRPKRDLAITLPADFSVSPAVIPDIVRGFESGADVIVTETMADEEAFGKRLVRQFAPWLLRPGVIVPGIRDFTSGVCGIRLVTLRNCFQDRTERLLASEGPSAFAELVARAAGQARQVVALLAPRLPRATSGTSDIGAVELAVGLLRTGRRVRIASTVQAVRRG